MKLALHILYVWGFCWTLADGVVFFRREEEKGPGRLLFGAFLFWEALIWPIAIPVLLFFRNLQKTVTRFESLMNGVFSSAAFQEAMKNAKTARRNGSGPLTEEEFKKYLESMKSQPSERGPVVKEEESK